MPCMRQILNLKATIPAGQEEEISVSKAQRTGACPACGSTLETVKFTDAFNVDGSVDPSEINEDLYCPKCDSRWIKEEHQRRAS